MKIDSSKIDNLISELEDLGRAQSVMASVSWSFAMSIGQITARIEREDWDGNEDRLQEMENRREELREVLGWAVRQANPDYVPTGADVAARIQEANVNDVTPDDEILDHLAAQYDINKSELKEAQAQNRERQVEQAKLQAEAARLYERSIVQQVDDGIVEYPGNELELNQIDGMKIVDRIAQKSADYASNTLALAMRQTRERRRSRYMAEYKLLKDIEQRSEDLLDELRHEYEAARSEEEPA